MPSSCTQPILRVINDPSTPPQYSTRGGLNARGKHDADTDRIRVALYGTAYTDPEFPYELPD